MTRERLKILLVVLLAIFTLGSMAEAAPKRVVRHRPRHSTRVATGTTSAVKKQARQTKPAARRPTPPPPPVKRRPTTKPR